MVTYKNKSHNARILPNFIGIGVKRSGTTWLYAILKYHPRIYLCPYRKESRFFDKNFKKGLNWYKSFFPLQKDANDYSAIGEIVPSYIYKEHAPKLIKNCLPNVKFIVIIRNPIKRLISEYNYYKFNHKTDFCFEDYLKKHPNAIERGFYTQYLKNWFNYFPRNRFLILIFEEVMDKKLKALESVFNFLNVDSLKFKGINVDKKINPSTIPRLHRLYTLGFQVNKYILSKDLYKLSDFVSRFKPLVYFLGKKENRENIDKNMEYSLFLKYKADIDELERILQRDLNIWKDIYL